MSASAPRGRSTTVDGPVPCATRKVGVPEHARVVALLDLVPGGRSPARSRPRRRGLRPGSAAAVSPPVSPPPTTNAARTASTVARVGADGDGPGAVPEHRCGRPPRRARRAWRSGGGRSRRSQCASEGFRCGCVPLVEPGLRPVESGLDGPGATPSTADASRSLSPSSTQRVRTRWSSSDSRPMAATAPPSPNCSAGVGRRLGRREPAEERPVPVRRPGDVVRGVRRRDEEPRQERVVDEADVVTAPPGLEEGHRDDVVRVGRCCCRDEADGMSPEPRGVPVEDPAEGLPVPRGSGPSRPGPP